MFERNTPPENRKASKLRAEEIKLPHIVLFDPLVFSSCLHGSRHVAVVHLYVRGPVLVVDSLVGDPEPGLQNAGEAQCQPDVGAGGVLGSLLDPPLLLSVSDGDQVVVVFSAVIDGLLPGLVLFDQDHIVCQGN